MRPPIAAMVFIAAACTPAFAQTAPAAPRIRIALEVRSEGQAARDAAGTRLHDDIRRGLDAIGDVQIVPAAEAARIIWIVAGSASGTSAASMIVTERYDRETLMVLGIEDDDTAARMMALQIVNDHQIFTGLDLQALAKRIVTSIDEGVLAKLRTTMQKR